MNTIELSIRGKIRYFSGPSSWDELTEKQAVALTRLRLGITEQPALVFAALTLLYGIKPRHQQWLFDEPFLRRKGLPEIDIDLTLHMGQLLLDTLSWIGKPAPRFPQRFRLLEHHFGSPLIWLNRLRYRRVYAGPGEALRDLTFAEFMYADRAFRAGDRVRLAAVLCRPLTAEGQREPFDARNIEENEPMMAQLDAAQLDRVYRGFDASMLVLQRAFPYVFPNEQPAAQSGKTAGTWLDVAIGMAKFDATKIAEIERINLYLALKVLNEQIRQADELEAQLADIRNK